MVVDAEQRLAELSPPTRRSRRMGDPPEAQERPAHHARRPVLRKTSLDELPQLWNVLKGDMSLVGPAADGARPGARFIRAGPITAIAPGLTGPWQISDRNETSFAGRADFDADYARRMSLRPT